MRTANVTLYRQIFTHCAFSANDNIVGGKRIMKLMGFDLGPNRTPFRNMTDEEEQAMKKELEAINFFERCNQF